MFASAFFLAALAPSLALAQDSQTGITLKLEGGVAGIQGADVGIFSLVRDLPATNTSQLNFEEGMARGPLSFGYRAEAKYSFDLGNGTLMRIGGIFSGQEGSTHEDAALYGFVVVRPGGPDPALPEAEIVICPFPNSCGRFAGDLDRSYHEVMPELMFGRAGEGGRMSWIGLQGFSGQFQEQTSNTIQYLPPFGPFAMTTTTDLAADAKGFVLAFQHERPMASGATVFPGGGLGTYTMDASGVSMDIAVPSSAKPVGGSFDGTRAQLAVGIEYPVRELLTIGATLRADSWSAQPRINMGWNDGACSPSLCEPPSRNGNFNLVTDPLMSLSVGVSLTLWI